ncbi:MAG: carboxypeptidase-like regulatory domain-containing protein, partial [Planctomycetota bacterium]
MRKVLVLLVALAIGLSVLRTCRTPNERPGLQRQGQQRTLEEPAQAADLTVAEEEDTPIPERTSATPAPTEEVRTSTAKKGGRLAGKVVDDAGTPVPGCRVELKNGGAERTQIAGKSGEFLFTEVRKGSVKLSVSSSATLLCFPTPYAHGCPEEERPWYGATCLDFDGSEKDSVVLVLRRAAFLEGRVVDSFGAPLSGAVAELKCDEVEFLRVMAEMELTGDDGRFSARVFPGTTRLRTFTSPGSALAGSGRPPEGEYLLGPGETLDVGDLIIGGGGVNLTGRVVNQKGYGVHLVPVRARLVGAPEWMTTETGRTGS